MLAHTRSDEKKQKKKKALLALGTRFCALQSQNFEVVVVTLSLVGMEMYALQEIINIAAFLSEYTTESAETC